jgi:hypothetical protein
MRFQNRCFNLPPKSNGQTHFRICYISVDGIHLTIANTKLEPPTQEHVGNNNLSKKKQIINNKHHFTNNNCLETLLITHFHFSNTFKIE